MYLVKWGGGGISLYFRSEDEPRWVKTKSGRLRLHFTLPSEEEALQYDGWQDRPGEPIYQGVGMTAWRPAPGDDVAVPASALEREERKREIIQLDFIEWLTDNEEEGTPVNYSEIKAHLSFGQKKLSSFLYRLTDLGYIVREKKGRNSFFTATAAGKKWAVKKQEQIEEEGA